jgi:hypothetical protein
MTLLIVLAAVFFAAGTIYFYAYLQRRRLDRGRYAVDAEALRLFNDCLDEAGFAYEPNGDIFVSKIDAWQRNFGYCLFFDSFANLFTMIIDFEPVSFEYGGKMWLIEFWKGQYGPCTGAEIGVYWADPEKLRLYNCYDAVPDSSMLSMSFSLVKSEKVLFTRSGRHWWLTGFMAGEFSEPEELEMEISVKLLSPGMLQAFSKALMKSGHRVTMDAANSSVSFRYGHPSAQNKTSRVRRLVVQRINRCYCTLYNRLVSGMGPFPADHKIAALLSQNPHLIKKIKKIGNIFRRGKNDVTA